MRGRVLAVCAGLFLTACDQDQLRDNNLKRQFFTIQSQYAAVKGQIAVYVSQPFCSEELLVGCAEPSLVVQLDEADDQVQDALDVAAAAINTGSATAGTQIDVARAALRSAILILAAAEGEDA